MSKKAPTVLPLPGRIQAKCMQFPLVIGIHDGLVYLPSEIRLVLSRLPDIASLEESHTID